MPTPSETSAGSIDQLAINTIRTLSMDAVQKANSGHPGTPMALAPVAYTLWNQLLRYDPDDPLWPSRDRFVLSCGHASMLLYSLLHLAGVKQFDEGKPTGEPAVTLDQIKHFRQLHSRTPGHPESRDTSGVETTTGPLGQGCGNSVGMAIAQRWRPDGRRGQRSRVAGGTSQAVELVLDLRQQSHHDRRPHAFGVRRRCGAALRGPRLARHQG
jgi:transketolase